MAFIPVTRASPLLWIFLLFAPCAVLTVVLTVVLIAVSCQLLCLLLLYFCCACDCGCNCCCCWGCYPLLSFNTIQPFMSTVVCLRFLTLCNNGISSMLMNHEPPCSGSFISCTTLFFYCFCMQVSYPLLKHVLLSAQRFISSQVLHWRTVVEDSSPILCTLTVFRGIRLGSLHWLLSRYIPPAT